MELKYVLKDLMKQKDLTVSQLSRATHVPRQTIDNWLSGQEPRSLSQVKDVANHLEVPLDYLCFGEGPLRMTLKDYEREIRAGTFEVILRKVDK